MLEIIVLVLSVLVMLNSFIMSFTKLDNDTRRLCLACFGFSLFTPFVPFIQLIPWSSPQTIAIIWLVAVMLFARAYGETTLTLTDGCTTMRKLLNILHILIVGAFVLISVIELLLLLILFICRP
ncbi:MAG: hypothetical protein MJ025_06590 [Victivallaceae bacterium]|nr:hypothetical protein [Victivallaceae bacterium]